MNTYMGEIPASLALAFRSTMAIGPGAELEELELEQAYIRTTLRPAFRSLFRTSTELLLGPMVQI